MKKITIVLLLIVSLILPQTVQGAEDDPPYNAWDSCAKNFVKYSNKGEYCIIVECKNSRSGIQYILCHDIANRNPLIYENGPRRFLNLFETSRYEVYYNDYVLSMTGLSSIFQGNKLELGIIYPVTASRAEIVRTNYPLYNINGNLIYDANYYSEVTEVVKQPDWLTDNRLTGNPYFLAVFKVIDESSSYYNHYIGMSLNGWKNYFNSGKKIYIPKVTEDMYDPWGLNNAFIYTDSVNFNFCDLGLTLEDSDISTAPSNWNARLSGIDNFYSGSTVYNIIALKDYARKGVEPRSYNEIALYNWDYGANIIYTGSAGLAPTPIVKPTAAPLASPSPIPGEDNGIFNLGNTIKRIFLPSPDILYNEVNASKNLLLEKLHINLDEFTPENGGGRPQNVTMTIYGHNVTLLDFEQVEEVAEQARTPINIVRVFIYIFALWGLIKFIIDYFNNRGGGNNA